MDFEEELLRSNQSQYGLEATLFTNDPTKVKRYKEEIEAGNVLVNDPLVDNLVGSYGGMKRSGIGRELGQKRFEEIFETKHVHWEINGGMKPMWFPRGE